MYLKFKDYICVIVPILLCIYMYIILLGIGCSLLNISEYVKIIMCITLTVLLSYPGIKLIYKYIEWYDNKYMEK